MTKMLIKIKLSANFAIKRSASGLFNRERQARPSRALQTLHFLKVNSNERSEQEILTRALLDLLRLSEMNMKKFQQKRSVCERFLQSWTLTFIQNRRQKSWQIAFDLAAKKKRKWEMKAFVLALRDCDVKGRQGKWSCRRFHLIIPCNKEWIRRHQ